MSVTSISDLAHQHMLSILGNSSASKTGHAAPNSNQLSPFAQMLTELQQMEQSNPSQYAKVSQQISTNLSAASSTAQARGNTALATQLTTLSKDFSTASQTGQLPNVGDLEKAMNSFSSIALGTSGAHSKGINIIGQVLSMVGI